MDSITDKFFKDFLQRALFELQLITVREIGIWGNNISSTFCRAITKFGSITIYTRSRSFPILLQFPLRQSMYNICNLHNMAACWFSIEFLP